LRTTRFPSRIIALLVVIAGSLLAPTPASAGGITVVENSVEHSFGQQVAFTLEASSDARISRIYLFFQATDDDETEKKEVSLEEPARQVSVRHVHNARVYPLPPFATITFWWQIEDVAGNRLETAPKRFKYIDNRFQWRERRARGITIHWVDGAGDPAYAQTALEVAQTSVQDVNAELRAPLPDPFDIYIYDSAHHLEAAMILSGRDWAGGQARPELGVVVVAVPPEEGYASRMKRYLPHEITHLLTYQRTSPEGYGHVPRWLDEGLATANEQLPTPEYALVLQEAYEANQLLPLATLCAPFSPDSHTAALSYAESASVVEFIREEYGADGIRRLLSAYADGASCTSGVEEALGVTFNKLESAWRASLRPEARWRAWVEQVDVWIGLWLLSLLVAVPMIGGIRRRRAQ
jgi:hypothetical protein